MAEAAGVTSPARGLHARGVCAPIRQQQGPPETLLPASTPTLCSRLLGDRASLSHPEHGGALPLAPHGRAWPQAIHTQPLSPARHPLHPHSLNKEQTNRENCRVPLFDVTVCDGYLGVMDEGERGAV